MATELRRPQMVADGHLLGPPKSAHGMKLAGIDLVGADLRGADLQKCDLRKADLTGAQLDGADLSWAVLDGATLRDVGFGRARLVETTLQGADVTGADLSGVTGLTWASIRNVEGEKSARWPAGFDRSQPRVAGPLIHNYGARGDSHDRQ
ncbi:MAG: pentapeptide repeat-containing protein [Acidimicrobiales bacterium]